MNISTETAITFFDTSARIPFVSSVTSAYTLYQQFRSAPERTPTLEKTFHAHVLDQSTYRSCVLLLPVLGNVLVYRQDLIHADVKRSLEDLFASPIEVLSKESWEELAIPLEKNIQFMRENTDLTFPKPLQSVLTLQKEL